MILIDKLVPNTKQIIKDLKTLFFWNCHNLAKNHPNFASWGCFGNLLFKMATEILKIDAS